MNTEPKKLNEFKEPKTIEEFKAQNDKLKAQQLKSAAENLELEEQVETAKRIIGRYKKKFGSLEAEDRPAITRVRFDR